MISQFHYLASIFVNVEQIVKSANKYTHKSEVTKKFPEL